VLRWIEHSEGIRDIASIIAISQGEGTIRALRGTVAVMDSAEMAQQLID
jgi:hypothetical protein